MYDGYVVSTHSRPKAAGRILLLFRLLITVSTHSRPKAAGFSIFGGFDGFFVSTHSRPKAAGCPILAIDLVFEFQHTAARRRLDCID